MAVYSKRQQEVNIDKDIALLFSDKCDKAGVIQMIGKVIESFRKFSKEDKVTCEINEDTIKIVIKDAKKERYHTYKDFGFEDDTSIIGFLPYLTENLNLRFYEDIITDFNYSNGHFIGKGGADRYTLEVRMNISHDVYEYDKITEKDLKEYIE